MSQPTNEERAKVLVPGKQAQWLCDEIAKALDEAEQRAINDCIAALEAAGYVSRSTCVRTLQKLLDEQPKE